MKRIAGTTIAIALLLASPAAARSRRVAVPPLPNPMPMIVKAACPGFPDATECVFQPGTADQLGADYPRGAVFTEGYRFATDHGLGHIYDATRMDDSERHAFAHILERPGELWSSTYTDDDGRLVQWPGSLAEVFADAYANCRLRHVVAPGHAWEAGYDYYPTPRENRRVCGLIKRAGTDPGYPASLDSGEAASSDSVPEPVQVGVQ
jgi:hypothetical protein